MPDYMRQRDIQAAFKETNAKVKQNHDIAELATKNIEKLNLSTVTMAEFET